MTDPEYYPAPKMVGDSRDGYDGEGDYHVNLQRLRARTLQTMVERIMQQIVGETPFVPDMEWELWNRCQELEEQNGLPQNVTAFDVYQTYLRVFEGE